MNKKLFTSLVLVMMLCSVIPAFAQETDQIGGDVVYTNIKTDDSFLTKAKNFIFGAGGMSILGEGAAFTITGVKSEYYPTETISVMSKVAPTKGTILGCFHYVNIYDQNEKLIKENYKVLFGVTAYQLYEFSFNYNIPSTASVGYYYIRDWIECSEVFGRTKYSPVSAVSYKVKTCPVAGTSPTLCSATRNNLIYQVFDAKCTATTTQVTKACTAAETCVGTDFKTWYDNKMVNPSYTVPSPAPACVNKCVGLSCPAPAPITCPDGFVASGSNSCNYNTGACAPTQPDCSAHSDYCANPTVVAQLKTVSGKCPNGDTVSCKYTCSGSGVVTPCDPVSLCSGQQNDPCNGKTPGETTKTCPTFGGGTQQLSCSNTCKNGQVSVCTVTCQNPCTGNEALFGENNKVCPDGVQVTCKNTCSSSTGKINTCTPDCTGHTTAAPVCGNNVVEAGETCDGTNFNSATCASVKGPDYTSGSLSCANCQVDSSACSVPPKCGDNVCNSGAPAFETTATCPGDCPNTACNAAVCGDKTCTKVGTDGKTVCESEASCPADCKAPPSCGNNVCDSGETCASCPGDCKTGCGPVCGDNICTPGENCPGDCIKCGNGQCENTETCTTCANDCQPCPAVCGNGKLEPPEACDTTNFGGLTCSSFGYNAGTLSCDSCQVNKGQCRIDAVCGNKVCEVGETTATCAGDCPSGCTGLCGDGTCNSDAPCTETESTCAIDCGEDPGYCGDQKCKPWESAQGCPADCDTCGNGFCSELENQKNCPKDCGEPQTCGNKVCDTAKGENYGNCPTDCEKPFWESIKEFFQKNGLFAIVGVVLIGGGFYLYSTQMKPGKKVKRK